MRLNFICSAIGVILKYLSLMLTVPIIIAIIDKDYFSIIPFLITSLVSLIIGLFLCHKKEDDEALNNIKKSEALFIVSFSWIGISLIAMIPYLFYGISPLNSLFEAVSGITTTGATILTHFDYPKALFFWRSYSQWLGGMGVIVLFIAILPQFRVAGRQMFFAEAPGPMEEKMTPRIRHTATALWGVYFTLTVLQIIAYKCAGMNIFDALCNAMSTMSAGGLSPNSNSIMGYNSSAITWITIIFMFLAGVNFSLQYKAFVQRKITLLFKNEEIRTYIGIFLGLSLCIGGFLYLENNYSVTQAIKHSLFQVISIMTSSGFSSTDWNQWVPSAKILLCIAMFTGACAGCAAGGIKIVRLIFIFKYIKAELVKIMHPNAVTPIKIDRTIISEEVGKQIISFFIFYILLFALSAFIVSIIEQNVVIGLSGSISMIGNVGPAFGAIGPTNNFYMLEPSTKLIFILLMLIGRLELIPFLAMLHPDFWRIKH